MSKEKMLFESLEIKLEKWFKTPFEKLPGEIVNRISEGFFPYDWRTLSPELRRQVAQQWDEQNTPDLTESRESMFDEFVQIESLKKQLAQWENAGGTSVGGLALKEQKVEELRGKIKNKYSSFEHDHGKGSYEVGSKEWRKKNAQEAANARHAQPGGSHDKRKSIMEIWSTGKYKTKSACAQAESEKLGMSFSTALKALREPKKR